MCTDEQWLPKSPTKTVATSSYWFILPTSFSLFQRNPRKVFWLNPLDVPKDEHSWYMHFPSPACKTHAPCKYR